MAVKKTAKPKTGDEEIKIPKLNIQTLQLVLVGDRPLIVHAWSKKAKQAMLDKQQKKASKGKEVRNPQRDYEESLYRMADKNHGFPAVAFKAAAVTACSQIDGVKKVFARQTFHILGGDLVRIYGDEPVMREDMVRVGMGTADLRYRGEFKSWWVDLDIEYNASAISKEQLVNIFNTSGFGVGVGEWRPEKDGRNGRYHVATETEAQRLRNSVKKRR
jgi:hypothetical protein